MYVSIFIQYFTSKVRLIGKKFNKDIHNLSGRKEQNFFFFHSDKLRFMREILSIQGAVSVINET